MNPVHALSEFFGEKAPTRKIHVVVELTDLSQYSPPLKKQRTSSNQDLHLPDNLAEQTFPMTPKQTRKKVEYPSPETKMSANARKSMIEAFLEKAGREIRDFLSSPPSIWKPQTDDAATLDFYERLAIPAFKGHPWLLLHNIRSRKSFYVDSLFAEGPTHCVLFNTSGAGKTTVLLDGLCKKWGFYFVAKHDGRIGAFDLEDAIDNMVSKPGWNKDVFAPGIDSVMAAKANAAIAYKWVYKTLLTRWHIFQLFIEAAKQENNGDLPDDAKHSWLLLQVTQRNAAGGDLFQRFMSECLAGIEVEELVAELEKFTPDRVLGSAFNQAETFFCVLDEAQYAGKMHPKAFVGADGTTARPVLRPILLAWQQAFSHTTTRFIFSGTGFSFALFTEVCTSAVGKPGDFIWKPVYDVGGFDTEPAQRAYIEQYLPPSFLNSPSGSLLVSRMYKWLRGRHRFTATFIEKLIEEAWTSEGPMSPHSRLDHYVAYYTEMTLVNDSNSGIFSNSEPKVVLSLFPGFIWDKLKQDTELARELSKMLWLFLTSGQLQKWDTYKNEIVEYGLASYVDGQGTVFIREPLALASVLIWFEREGCSLASDIRDEYITSQGRAFERTLTLSLATVFQDYTALSDIFGFRGPTPEWAMQKARIVRRAENGFVGLPGRAFHSESSFSCVRETPEAVSSWLRSETSTFCIPGNLMGPDLLVRLELEDGRIFLLLVQAKCFLDAETITARVAAKAIKSLDPGLFFHSLKKTSKKAAVATLLESINVGTAPFIGPKYDILRVIAAYPKGCNLNPETQKDVKKALAADAHPLAILKHKPFLESLVTYDHHHPSQSQAMHSLSTTVAL